MFPSPYGEGRALLFSSGILVLLADSQGVFSLPITLRRHCSEPAAAALCTFTCDPEGRTWVTGPDGDSRDEASVSLSELDIVLAQVILANI